MQTSNATDAAEEDEDEIPHSVWELDPEDQKYEFARSASRAAGRRLQELRRQENVAR